MKSHNLDPNIANVHCVDPEHFLMRVILQYIHTSSWSRPTNCKDAEDPWLASEFFPTLSNDELFYLFEGVYNILHMLYPSTDFATSVVFYYFRQIKSRGILVQSSSMCSACKICLVLFFCYDSIRFVVATFKMSVSHWVNSNIKMNDLICISYLIFIVAKQDREINVKRLKIVPDLTGNRCNLISYLN